MSHSHSNAGGQHTADAEQAYRRKQAEEGKASRKREAEYGRAHSADQGKEGWEVRLAEKEGKLNAVDPRILQWTARALPNTPPPQAAGGGAADPAQARRLQTQQINETYRTQKQATKQAGASESKGGNASIGAKPIEVPTFTVKELASFDEKLVSAISDFEGLVRAHKDSPEIGKVKDPFEAALQKAMGIVHRQFRGARETLDKLQPSSSGGKSEKTKGLQSVDLGDDFVRKAMQHTNGGQYVQAAAAFKQGYLQVRPTLDSIQIVAKDSEASLDNIIDTIRKVQGACEVALTVLGGEIGGAAKIAAAVFPAVAQGIEKASSELLFHMPSDIRWADVVTKGLIDGFFAKLSSAFEDKFIGEIDYKAALKGLGDPNLLKFAASHVSDLVLGVVKECWSRAGKHMVNAHYGTPDEAVAGAADVVGAVWGEYSTDRQYDIIRALLKHHG